jgi:hypothetical protein
MGGPIGTRTNQNVETIIVRWLEEWSMPLHPKQITRRKIAALRLTVIPLGYTPYNEPSLLLTVQSIRSHFHSGPTGMLHSQLYTLV